METYNENEKQIIPVIIAGLDCGDNEYFDHSMEEFESLVEACDMEAVCIMTQSLPHPDAGTYMGSGKVDEIRQMAENLGAEYCIFEDNLSPAQLKNLTSIIGIPVWDRTTLILEIFSRRAKTREARLQVESAYLQYMLPRLSGMWQHLGRQGGGGGSRANKGVGETQLELDRRQIKHRIGELSGELKNIESTRSTQRSGRKRADTRTAALVGYTNAGKSTIMNAFLDMTGASEEKKVLEQDMLFATLDTSIRHIWLDDNRDFLLSDTVGFIENLPHGLIKAFHSTLEEAACADLLIIVLDSSDPFVSRHRKITEDTLRELGAGDIPRIYVMNKADLMESREFGLPSVRDDTIWLCARDEACIAELKKTIADRLYGDVAEYSFLVPYERGDLTDLLHRQARVLSEEYVNEGTVIKAVCTPKIYGRMKIYEQ